MFTLLTVTGWVRIQLPDVIKNKANFNTDGGKNAASRGGHRALAIPQSFLHTPSDANPVTNRSRHNGLRCQSKHNSMLAGACRLMHSFPFGTSIWHFHSFRPFGIF